MLMDLLSDTKHGWWLKVLNNDMVLIMRIPSVQLSNLPPFIGFCPWLLPKGGLCVSFIDSSRLPVHGMPDLARFFNVLGLLHPLLHVPSS